MARSPVHPFARLKQFVDGFQVSDAVAVAARLDVASLLRDGPRSAESLAAELGVNASALYRLLRALSSVGVFAESPARTFELNDVSTLLLPDVPGSLRAWSIASSRPYVREAWSRLEDAVRSGENAFALLHAGTSVWEWRAADAEESALFDAAMSGLSSAEAAALASAFNFGQFETVVDVGGGDGTLLDAILAAHPGVRGILFDQPHIIEAAEKAGTGARSRRSAVGGSFFEAVPAGCDAYVLSHILHDWGDSDCLRILAAIRAAAKADSRLLVAELVVGPPNEDAVSKLMDLHMLAVPGGQERTEDEWRELLAAGGFSVSAVHRTASRSRLIEAMPAEPGGQG